MDPFTLLAFGAIALVVWLRRPSSQTGPLFPAPGDMLTVKIDRPGAENPAYSLSPQVTSEIVNAFATRGYAVMPVANENRPTGARNSYLRGFQVSSAAASIEIPPNLGPGLSIVGLRRAPGAPGIAIPLPRAA